MPNIDKSNKYKVRLKSSSIPNQTVVFEVTPDVIETRNVNYKSMDPIHMPGSIYVYGSSSSRTFNVTNIRLISRTTEEATKNLEKLWLLRSWTMPYFGKSGELTQDQVNNRAALQDAYSGTYKQVLAETPDDIKYQTFGKKLLGAPPDVLRLFAYSDSTAATRTYPMNIHNVPVVIVNLSIPYPSDTDYIPAENGVPVPTIMTIDMQLTETRAPKELSDFSLEKYRQGILDTF